VQPTRVCRIFKTVHSAECPCYARVLSRVLWPETATVLGFFAKETFFSTLIYL
jgi:hypothetical protein